MDPCFFSASSSFFNVFISSSFCGAVGIANITLCMVVGLQGFFFLLTSATDVLSLRISSLDIEEIDIREPLLSCGVLGAREDLIPVFT